VQFFSSYTHAIHSSSSFFSCQKGCGILSHVTGKHHCCECEAGHIFAYFLVLTIKYVAKYVMSGGFGVINTHYQREAKGD
jgi:hypothetical protein